MKRTFADLPPTHVNPLDYAVAARDTRTLTMVQDAIAHGQTVLAYQPVMIAHDPSRIAFYEGLIRVLDDTGRVIPATDFIQAIEATDTGRQIDVLALRMGLKALDAHPTLRLSINMSARSIGYSNWMATLNRWLKRNPTIGERLILEITESSAMMMPEVVSHFMDDLQTRGVCFAMDDFGAGFTAIRYFKDFYFDVLKIDGHFIRGIANNPDNRAITAALISIARHFDMMTVAEFVENAEDVAVLNEMGIDCLQGYFFAAPTTRPSWMEETQKLRAIG